MSEAAKWTDRTVVRRARHARSAESDERRAAIVDAALEVIEALGPTVGTSQIAERAGVPRPHVYRHFESKEELDAEITRRASAQLREAVRPTLTTGKPIPEVLHDAIGTAVGWAAEHPNLYRFLAARQQTRALHRVRLGRGRFLDMFVEAAAGITGAATDPGPVPDGVLAGMVGMIDSSIIWWLDHDDESQVDVVVRLSRQVMVVVADLFAQHGLPDPATIVLPGLSR